MNMACCKEIFSDPSKRLLCAAGVLFVLTAASLALVCTREDAPAARTGYVDVRKVIAAPKIKAVFDKHDAALQEMVKDVQARTEKAAPAEAAKIRMEFEDKFEKLRDESAGEQKKIFQAAAGEVLKEKGLDVIVSSDLVISGGQDVTKEVMEKLE